MMKSHTRLNLKPDAGVDDLGRIPADVEPGGDDGENAGGVAEAVGQQVAEIGP